MRDRASGAKRPWRGGVRQEVGVFAGGVLGRMWPWFPGFAGMSGEGLAGPPLVPPAPHTNPNSTAPTPGNTVRNRPWSNPYTRRATPPIRAR